MTRTAGAPSARRAFESHNLLRIPFSRDATSLAFGSVRPGPPFTSSAAMRSCNGMQRSNRNTKVDQVN